MKNTIKRLSRNPVGLIQRAPSLACLLIACLVVYATLAARTTYAITYYLDAVNGNDSYPGTVSQPWKTIDRAQIIAQGGDVVILRNGNYGSFVETNDQRTQWLTYRAETGHSPTLTNISLGNNDGSYNKYLRFQDINVTGKDSSNRAIFTNHVNYVDFINITISPEIAYTVYDQSRGMYLYYSSYITIEGGSVKNFETGYGTRGVNDVNIVNTVITNCDKGISMWGHRMLVQKNHLYNLESDGIIVACSDSNIIGNTIHHIHDSSNQGFHTDGIQVYHPASSDGFDPCNVTISGNRVYDIEHQGIYIAAATGQTYNNFTVMNNLVYGCGSTTFQTYGATNLVLKHNIIMGHTNLRTGPDTTVKQCYGNIFEYLSIYNGVPVTYENYNILKKWWTAMDPAYVPGSRTVELQTDAAFFQLFAKSDSNDFHPSSTSLAINFCPLAPTLSIDIDGNPRDSIPDAGCYEYVGNKPPNADAGPNQTVTDSDQSGSEQVTLDGSGSSDPDGSIVSYIWSESGRQIATGVRPTVTLSVGRHIITLQVTDNSGLTDTDTVVITIEVEEGLVGLWKFEDGSGLYANDSSGYSITGRLVNNPLWTTQGEISFDGNNDAVEINTATLNISSGTVALWVKPREFSKSKHYLFGHLTQPANNRIQLFCNASGTLGVGLGDNASLNTNIQTLNTQEWYHIALTWSNTSYAVFVDGQQKASGTFDGISAVQTYADIGNSGNRSQLSEAFYGLIDEVRLYNRALSADEVANHALVFLPIGNKTIDEGEMLTFPVKTNFGNIVEISDSNLPHSPSFASNVFTWTPDYDDAGTYEVEFTAPHGSGEDFERITVTVMDTQQEEPVGYWKFDETSGDIAADASISDNTGYLENGLTWDSGEFNGSVVFSVPNDAVEIKTTNFSANSGTISMWVDVERLTLSRHYLFGHSDSKLNNRIQLYLKYGNLCLGLGNSNTTSMNIQLLEYHKWYHICLTWSRTTYGVYVDGLRKANGTFRGLTGFADHADIGNNGTTRDKGLNGRIDDVRIYNRVLDANEITGLALGQ